jgi:hypothetical protein
MHRPKKQNLFVIFALPQQLKGPGTVYYAEDASITDIKSKAAKFLTFDDAKNFAEKNNIELTAATYIGLEAF